MDNNKLKEATFKCWFCGEKPCSTPEICNRKALKFWEKEVGLVEEYPRPTDFTVRQDKPKPSLEEAIEVLCNALREDTSEGSYYDKLRQDLSKSLFNDMTRFKIDIKGLPCISVQMAENFLSLLINK